MGTILANVGLAGNLRLGVITKAERERAKRREILAWKVRHFFKQRWREIPLEIALWILARLTKVIPGLNVPMHGRLYMKVTRGNGEVWDYGHVGCHLIVTAGKNYLAGCFPNTNEPENLK